MSNQEPEHVLSLSYGKDSLACLGAIDELGWPLDRIVHVEVWATDTIPAELPPMVEFKAKADRIIRERWGFDVQHIRAGFTFEELFYKPQKSANARFDGHIRGFPAIGRNWCTSSLKTGVIKKTQRECISYIGIASDEPNRFHNLTDDKKSPLVEAGWTEAMCRKWCEENDLLSPIYTTTTRGGCWFCYNQSIQQLRFLRKNYKGHWAFMLKWDRDSPVYFDSHGRTLRDFERRFALEDRLRIDTDVPGFRWEMLDKGISDKYLIKAATSWIRKKEEQRK